MSNMQTQKQNGSSLALTPAQTNTEQKQNENRIKAAKLESKTSNIQQHKQKQLKPNKIKQNKHPKTLNTSNPNKTQATKL